MKGSAYLSGKSMRAARSEMSRGRQSIDNALGTFQLHLRSSTVLDDEVTNAFDPNSRGIKIWDQVLLLGFLYEVFLLPLFLAFGLDSFNDALLATAIAGVDELLFLFDLYVKAHTGFYCDGNLVRDRRRTRRRYFRSLAFVLDVVALIPFTSFSTLSVDQQNKLGLVKLVRVYRMVRFVASLDEFYTAHFVVVKLLKVIVGTVFLSHVIACVRIVFGYNTDGINEWLPEELDHEHGGDSVRARYLQALFWGFGVLTGLFEGELPHSIAQFLFTISVACCGFFVFVTLCATIFVISKCESGQTEAVEARINQLVHLLSYHRVPENVQSPAIEYLRRYHTDAESNDREAIKLLCPSIATDIQVELLKTTVAGISIFEGCSEQFIVALTSLLKAVTVPAHTVVFSAGDPGDAMYIVHSGVLNVLVRAVKVREMRKGVCFGEVSVFSDMPRSATVTSATYSILYQLSRFHCERVLEGYPICAALVRSHVQRMISGLAPASSTTTDSSRSGTKVGSKLSSIGKTIKKNFSTVASVKKSVVLPSLVRSEQEEDGSGRSHGGANVATTNGDSAPASSRGELVTADETAERTMTVSNHLHHLVKYYDQADTTRPGGNHTSAHCGCMGLLLRLLPEKCIDADSVFRKRWLLLLQVNLLYYWTVVPLQFIFPLWQRPSPTFIALDAIMDTGLLIDLILNFSLSFTVDAEKIMDPRRSAQRYLRRGFLMDLLCILPYSPLLSAGTASYGILRLPRLARLVRLPEHLDQIEHFFQFTSKHRLVMFGILMCMMYHVIACLHFGITYLEGFSHEEESWIPCDDIYLRVINDSYYEGPHGHILHSGDAELRSIGAMQYFRSLYYATNVLAALGKTIEPESETQFGIALLFMLNGFLITAIVVDNVQKRFTASAFEQKEFFATRTRIQLFLRRQNAPSALHHRVNSFLDFWWSAHRGAVIEELLADLPPAIKLDVLRSICRPVLQTIALLAGVRSVLDKLEEFLVEHTQFILYGQGEVVYWKGDYVAGIFFLLDGEVCLMSPGTDGGEEEGVQRTVPAGSFFGTAALADAEQRGNGYAERASAVGGCIMMFLSRDHLSAMTGIFPSLFNELLALERRLQNNKFAKAGVGRGNHRGSIQSTTLRQATSRRLKMMVFGGSGKSSGSTDATSGPIVLDPDSAFALAWETFLFIIMSVQWITIIYQVSFRTVKSMHVTADAITAVIELFFLVDLFIRMRLGYYEYGTKVMEPRRIRRAYFRSTTFALDVIALIPLFIINWFLPAQQRLDMLNVTKLLRLFKVPQQLHTLENRYLKLTIELRLFKLLYYAFMLTHIFGCIWFDFASNSSNPNREPVFGSSSWLPPAYLQFASASRQYFASIFWAFGLMSASSTGELPKTTTQCLFSVFTMTCGFFLFAYVVGNFTDIIELMDAENREFNERLGSVRQLLTHFDLPAPLQERLKTFYLFRRFHSITREHILARCLPPSLLTDIRLVHLKPMIDKVEFLSGMGSSVTRLLVSQFGQLLVTRDEFVCRYGDDASDMFFVFVGVLDVLIPDDNCGGKGDNDKPVVVKQLSGASRRYLLPAPPKTSTRKKQRQPQVFKKLNEISTGGYFGENGLFTRSKRNAAIQARTSCILYKLSRESLELVFDRYPEWKQRVMRITSIREEQARLAGLAAAEVARRPTYGYNTHAIPPPSPSKQQEQASSRIRVMFLWIASSAMATWSGVRRCVMLITEGAEAQSAFHLWWLRLTVVATVYMAAIVPYRVVMDALDRSTLVPTIAKALEVFCEVLFIIDIWFSWHVRRSAAAMELYEQPHRAQYKKERLLWDVISAMPLDRFLSEFTTSAWLRLLRCAKTVNVVRYLDELNRRSVQYEPHYAARVILFYFLSIYWAACAYLAIAMHVGFGEEWDVWRPSTSLIITDPSDPSPQQLMVRFLRAMFYATTAFVKKGRTFIPDSTTLLEFSIAMSFTGLMVMSFVLGELANLFLSYIGLEVNFRKNHIAVEQYLARLEVSEPLKARAQKFMISLWSSHAGVNYEEVFADMPLAIRSSCVYYVSRAPVDWFVMRIFQPCTCWSATSLCLDPAIDSLSQNLARQLQFEGYPGGESVLVEGSISSAMYFVLRGHLELQSSSIAALVKPVGLRRGDFFGERGLLGGAVSTFTVRTVRACDLLALHPESLLRVLQEHETTRLALDIVHRAYSHLRADLARSSSTSRTDMKKHWGSALLRVVLELKADSESGHLVLGVGGDRTSSRTGSMLYSRETYNTVAAASTLEEYVQEMALVLETPSECLDAFGALLQVVLPVDPFNWQASIGRVVDATNASSEPNSGVSPPIDTTNLRMPSVSSFPSTSVPGKSATSPKARSASSHSRTLDSSRSFRFGSPPPIETRGDEEGEEDAQGVARSPASPPYHQHHPHHLPPVVPLYNSAMLASDAPRSSRRSEGDEARGQRTRDATDRRIGGDAVASTSSRSDDSRSSSAAVIVSTSAAHGEGYDAQSRSGSLKHAEASAGAVGSSEAFSIGILVEETDLAAIRHNSFRRFEEQAHAPQFALEHAVAAGATGSSSGSVTHLPRLPSAGAAGHASPRPTRLPPLALAGSGAAITRDEAR